MRKYGLPIAIALLVLVNIVVLAGAARNRSGEPDAVVELTERELPLSAYPAADNRENTGISLRLNWNQYPFYGKFYRGQGGNSQYDWFDKARLEEIGFDCSMPLTGSKAEIHYEKMLPRKAYAVLEYEGELWQAWLERERTGLSDIAERVKKGTATDKDLKEANNAYERLLKTSSRLFAVDAGKDPVKLRHQYPDRKRFIITAAKVGLHFARPYYKGTEKKEPLKLGGYLSEILVDEIHVPRTMSSILDAILTKAGRQAVPVYSYGFMHDQEPSYKVTLYYGKRFEPWVGDVTGSNF